MWNISLSPLGMPVGDVTTQQDFTTVKEEIAFTRRKEALKAANFLGVSAVNRLGVDDGMSIALHETPNP